MFDFLNIIVELHKASEIFLNFDCSYNLLTTTEENTIILKKLPFCCDYRRDTHLKIIKTVDTENCTPNSIRAAIQQTSNLNKDTIRSLCSNCNSEFNPTANQREDKVIPLRIYFTYKNEDLSFKIYLRRKRGLEIKYCFLGRPTSLFLKHVKGDISYNIPLINKKGFENEYIINFNQLIVSETAFKLGRIWFPLQNDWMSVDNFYISHGPLNNNLEPLRAFSQHFDLSALD